MPFESHDGKTWKVEDGASSEVELCELLQGFIRMLKPDLIVETGTYNGTNAFMMSLACEMNRSGQIVTCDPVKSEELSRLLNENVVQAAPLKYVQCSSLDLPELRQADLVFSDSLVPLRPQEYGLAKPGCVFVVHDTNNADDWTPKLKDWVHANGGLTFPAGRGFGILIKPLQ